MLIAGATLEDACAEVGVSRTTVNRWIAKGRRQPDTPAGEFAAEIDRAQSRAKPAGDDPDPAAALTTDQLVALLEGQAREGKLSAIQLLLKRPWEQEPPTGGARDTSQPASDAWSDLDDETAGGPADELAPRRRAQARAQKRSRPKRRRRAS
jgi:hypothetical protein